MKRCVTILAFIVQSVAYGQQAITGKVVEEGTGEALPFASVTIKGTLLASTTNADGFFSIHGVPASRDSIIVSYVGYRTRSFRIPEERNRLHSFALSPIAGELKEVVVDANSYKVLNAS